MKKNMDEKNLQITEREKLDYPLWGILAVALLLFASLFLTRYLVYPVFLVCLYRVIRYDIRVFSTDYCVLIPLATLFQTAGGTSLLIYLCLIAAVWYAFRGGICVNAAFCILLILLNYLFLRMQLEISKMILIFGQLFLLYVLLPQQNSQSAERSAKAFCISLFVSSIYALAFRNTGAMIALRGREVPAFWGSSFMRFQGLFEDPNYYMMMLLTGIALLLKLRDSRRMKRGAFLIMCIGMILLGVLTYSKTFLLVFIILVGIYILWQYRNRKSLFATMIVVMIAIVAAIMLLSSFSPISVIMTRFLNASSISELTTGRTDVFTRYWDAITRNMGTFIFGGGFAAPRLGKDTHNLYLEILYHIGALGLLLLAGFYGSMVHAAQQTITDSPEQNIFAKYAVILTVLAVFFSLHGMFSIMMYGVFYLAFLSILLTKNTEVN